MFLKFICKFYCKTIDSSIVQQLARCLLMPYGHTTPRQSPLKMDAAATTISGCLNAVSLVRTGTNGVTQQFPVFRHIVSGNISHDVPLAFLVV